MRSLEFTTVVSQCLGCHFCPQDKLGAAYKSDNRVLSMDNFRLIISKLPHEMQIHFSGFAEPFLSPLAGEMMHIAHQLFAEVHVYSTLVGIKTTDAVLLKEKPPRVFRVHVPDGKHLVYPEDKWVEYLERFLLSGIKASYMAMGEPSTFIKRHLAIRNIVLDIPTMLSRGGNLEHVATHTPFEGPIRCTMNRWHSNVVLPNGDVYGCCMDYSLSVYLGNLLRQPYKEIEYEATKWQMNMEKKAEGICAKCEWATRA